MEPMVRAARAGPMRSYFQIRLIPGIVKGGLLHVRAKTMVCDVVSVSRPDLGTVDALCRLHVSGAGMGMHLRLRHASPELRALLSLVGPAHHHPPQGFRKQGAQDQYRRKQLERRLEEGIWSSDDEGWLRP
jgi:hypothetical protein